jgi:hypothetical protein
MAARIFVGVYSWHVTHFSHMTFLLLLTVYVTSKMEMGGSNILCLDLNTYEK